MSPDFGRDVHCVLGLPFDAVDESRAAALIRDAARARRRCFMSTPNLNFAVGCLDDDAFRDSVLDSDLSLPDGMPIVWIARLLGVPIRERVSGAGLFERLREETDRTLRVYFFGGPQGVAAAACDKLNERVSGMRCVGSDSPGFGSIEEMSGAERRAKIDASGADFIVVSLGAKKGQAWIQHNRERLDAPVISHLGAVVNFVAGTVNRAPRTWQRVGLEWLWRIVEEPALWRRYAGDGAVLLRLLFGRVLPLAWCLRTRRPGAAQSAGACIERRDAPGRVELRLAGPWSLANLDRLRAAFAAVAGATGDLHIDLTGVVHMDAAAIAQLCLLRAACRRTGRGWSVAGPSSRLQRLLRWACADYLLQASAPVLGAVARRQELAC